MDEIEITVKVDSSYEKLHSDLIQQGFKIIDEFFMEDIYMIDKNIDTSNMKDLDVLSKCVLIREVNDYKAFVFKIKEYDENENIISQRKIDCRVHDILEAVNFLNLIGYVELIKIKNNSYIYSNDDYEIAVQLVNDKYIFIEMEANEKYNTIDSLISEFSKLNIDYDRNNYFSKKAQIILNERGCN